jgi:predicted membrane-bound spermidine synthase
MNKTYLYFTVFAAGMSALAIELSAARLLGSVFGTSNLVWATIIGLILVYLAVGNLIGGHWADRSPRGQTLFSILAWAALMIGIVPFISRPVLSLAADAFDLLNMGVLFGSFAAILILFSIPVTLLGTISPFAIRLSIVDLETSGKTAGRLYAISTLGSFIGAFLPPLVMIPLLGTTMTFLCFSLFLSLVALAGLWLANARRRLLSLAWIPVVLVIAMLLVNGRAIKTSSGQIYETESAYNYIQVLEKDGIRMLRLNEGQGIHSVWHPERLDFGGPWEQFLAAPFFNPAPYDPGEIQRIAIIGLAAGTFAHQVSAVLGAVPMDGFEIDPEIIRVGRQFFDMNQPELAAIAEDGRWGLSRRDQRYSLIAMDAYRPPYIPWHLTTQEFFQEVRQHLTEDGVVAMNVGSDANDLSLIEGLVSTLRTVFPSVYLMEVPGTFNYIIYASVQPTSIENLYQNYISLAGKEDVHPLLLASIQRVIENQRNLPAEGQIFTDNHAPIEWITNRMVLNFLLFDDLELIK